MTYSTRLFTQLMKSVATSGHDLKCATHLNLDLPCRVSDRTYPPARHRGKSRCSRRLRAAFINIYTNQNRQLFSIRDTSKTTEQ